MVLLILLKIEKWSSTIFIMHAVYDIVYINVMGDI